MPDSFILNTKALKATLVDSTAFLRVQCLSRAGSGQSVVVAPFTAALTASTSRSEVSSRSPERFKNAGVSLPADLPVLVPQVQRNGWLAVDVCPRAAPECAAWQGQVNQLPVLPTIVVFACAHAVSPSGAGRPRAAQILSLVLSPSTWALKDWTV